MDPPAIVHGRAYGKRDLILQHFNDIVPKDGKKNQAFDSVWSRETAEVFCSVFTTWESAGEMSPRRHSDASEVLVSITNPFAWQFKIQKSGATTLA